MGTFANWAPLCPVRDVILIATAAAAAVYDYGDSDNDDYIHARQRRSQKFVCEGV